MSVWALAFPAEAAIPVVESLVLVATRFVRPLLGLGAMAGLLVLFRPLLVGLLRAALLLIRPRQTLAQRTVRQEARDRRNRLRQSQHLLRLAQDFDASQPSLAAELRGFTARD
jgi:hypothetical protein